MQDFVLVLTGAATGSGVLEDMAREICGGMSEPQFAPPVWLSRGEACEISCRATDLAEARDIGAMVAARYAQAPVDINVVPVASRRKMLLVADMDSTIIEQECIDEIADLAGIKPAIAAITERAMRGELPFEPALRERVALLAGLPETALDKVMAERVTLMPGARILTATMRAHGAYCALVSGGFTYFTSRVAARAGFDEDRANVLEIADGKLAGRVREPILGRAAKLEALEELTRARGLYPAATMAVGDGANDLAMIKAAGLGVAYRAKPVVAAEAQASIRHGDLTALLYLQGYRREEFREG